METELTLNELIELSYSVRSKMDETREQIVHVRMILDFEGTDQENFNKILKYYEQELSRFEAIESKLEKMKTVLWDAK
ncbi:hypothetical protein [Leptospira alstonii]|uniref:Uncharacterized protein n=2 Tax=Leptospira alstonii TaxID=28452 RepID=M6CXN2_9LEPT|nr:hypothetical protein [Leptospira alstonii]EMJ96642.1 hypothetical protein LEP1GSC194_4305 [Leptospira alstonii serovar Sichuan str. 79601]EQA78741.1 hypothetical protein LEP1GSC193_1691 [Leptospira alstonii serovar Pingchang str. 80-412]